MRRLNDILSPVSWLFMWLSIVTIMFAILRPGFLEYIILVVVDFGALFIFRPFLVKIFYKINPVFTSILDDQLSIKTDIGSGGPDKMRQNFLLLTKFPQRWATYSFLVSWVKAIPAIFVMLFVWKYERTLGEQASLVAFQTFLTFFYFYATCFLETHIFLSKKFKEDFFNEKWGEALLGLNAVLRKDKYELFEFIVLVVIFITGILFQSYIVLSGLYTSKYDLLVRITVIGVASYMLFFRFRYLFQKFLLDSLRELFAFMNDIENQRYDFFIPLHTAPILNKFENSFNSLLTKIKNSDRELTSLILEENEKSRYRTVGEMSALILHDLANPMNILKFCSEKLVADTSVAGKNSDYPNVIYQNVIRCLDLISSFKLTLKGSTDRTAAVSFFPEVHTSIMRILETQYLAKGFRSIEVSVATELYQLELAVDRTDLSQILDNIYRNSYDHLLLEKRDTGRIKISLVGISDGNAEILIADNGSGLSMEQFEAMVSRLHLGQKNTSMGLKLTKKLVEIYGGSLTLVPGAEGTCFSLKLPSKENGELEYESNLDS